MPALILVVVVIVIGVAIALRSATSQERSSPILGLWSLMCGLAAVVGVAMIGQATYGWMSGFDPPGWLRILTFWMIPAGIIGSTILGTLSLKRNSGRMLGITGLALTVLSIVAFSALLLWADY